MFSGGSKASTAFLKKSSKKLLSLRRCEVKQLMMLIALFVSAQPPTAGAQNSTPTLSAQEMVIAMDRVRNPGEPFRVTNTLVQYIDGAPRDHLVLIGFSKLDRSSGQFDSLLRYVAPTRDEGKLMLMAGNKLYFYDPASKATVRLSPQQRVIGQASNADVVTINFARDYKATLVGAEVIEDAQRHSRDCWHLDLVAANSDAMYGRVEFWLEKGSYLGVKGKYYSDSARLLKIAYWRNYAQQLGGLRPTEAIIIDAVDPKQVTTMTWSDWRFQDIPDSWFQREFLPNFRVD
jgi:hypothetical protein